jgi:hypothetical protein
VIRLGRREFLKGAGGAAAAGLIGPALSFACARDATLERALVDLLSDPAGAAAVGREWLAQAPDEAGAARLVEALAGAQLAEWRQLAAGGADALRPLVRARHVEDRREAGVGARLGAVADRGPAVRAGRPPRERLRRGTGWPRWPRSSGRSASCRPPAIPSSSGSCAP